MVTKLIGRPRKKPSGTRFVRTTIFHAENEIPKKLTEKEKVRVRKVVRSLSKLNKEERKVAINKFIKKFPKLKKKKK